jgi:2-amino-4-hydroxy-6-hydroxymethyldihydropteridine diphosphokinase
MAADETAPPEEVIAYLSLGSNLGDRRRNLERAVQRLGGLSGIRIGKVSPTYRTAPMGVREQPGFLNLAVEAHTNIQPRQLLHLLKNIERELGRTSTERWGPRVIDIDILLYGCRRINEHDLIIPHPRMHERAFMMVPLADIAPNLTLPDGRRAADVASALAKEQGIQPNGVLSA